MVLRDGCPQCKSPTYKKNGHIHTGKQNHQCQNCGRQFVQSFAQYRISDDTRALIERLLAVDLNCHGCQKSPGHCLSRGGLQSQECQTTVGEDSPGVPSAGYILHRLARKTNHLERFNNTLRQRVSRLVRETLSFSKKLANHIGAIKHFICHYHLTRTTALPV
jgi:IS1 transposase